MLFNNIMNDDTTSSGNIQNLEDELSRIEEIANKDSSNPPNTQPGAQPPLATDTEPSYPTMENRQNENLNRSVQAQPTSQPQTQAPVVQDLQAEENIPQPLQPLPNDKKSSKTVLIIAIVFFFLSLAGLGFYYLGSKKAEVEETPIPVPTEISLPTPSADPTANWKTYTTLTYQVKYPQDVNFREDEGSFAVFSKLGPTQTEGTEVFDGFSVSFQPKVSSGMTLDAYVAAEIEAIKKQNVSEVVGVSKSITINDYQGLTFTEKGLGEFTHIILQSDNKEIFMEILTYVADPGNLGFQSIIDTIFSTFKFLEFSTTPSITPTSSASATPTATL
jgi:hypothetical protein